MIGPAAPSPSRNPEEISVPSVRFLAEQDGAPEQLLKRQLTELFRRHDHIQRAYLAQVNAGDQVSIALCLKHLIGPDRDLVQQVGRIFSAVFNAREHLDIIFLNDEQESAIVKVCAAFFGESPSTR